MRFYAAMIDACLVAAGAPAGLVTLLTGFGETGAALTASVDLMTFVGSTRVGKMVITLTPNLITLVTLTTLMTRSLRCASCVRARACVACCR